MGRGLGCPSMGCIVGCITLAFPKFVLFIFFLSGNYLGGAYKTEHGLVRGEELQAGHDRYDDRERRQHDADQRNEQVIAPFFLQRVHEPRNVVPTEKPAEMSLVVDPRDHDPE